MASTISTGSRAIDALIGGGIRTGMLTDIYGESGSGKSQLCFTLCANCGKDDSRRILFVDTLGTFRPERIVEITGSLATLEKIKYVRVLSTQDQRNAILKIMEIQPTLVVVDSLTSLFSTEYSGPERHRAVMKHLHDLAVLAITSKTAIVVTNMIRAAPSIMLRDKTRPHNMAEAVVPWQQREFLGSTVSMHSHIKMKLEIIGGASPSFQATLMQPQGARRTAPFSITSIGVSDVNDPL